MTDPTRRRPSLWAVGLLFTSSVFALTALALASTGYSPF